MKTIGLTVPEVVLIGGTRVALGVGVGLLLSGKLTEEQRRAAGFSLLAVGAMTTVPILMSLFSKPDLQERKQLAA